MSTTRRSSRGWMDEDDEMVPIRGDRVTATMRVRRISTSELARRVGESQQTIDLIVRGRSKKCRRSRLRAIAKTLRVSMKWLASEIDALPFANYQESRIDDSGQLVTYSKGEYDAPSLQQLVEHEFGRVLFNCLASREPPSDAHTKGHLTDPAHFWMWWAVRRLISPASWAAKLLSVDEGEKLRWSREEYELAVEALTKAFTIILRPWFKGEASLDGWQLPLTVTKFSLQQLPGGEDTVRKLTRDQLWPQEP